MNPHTAIGMEFHELFAGVWEVRGNRADDFNRIMLITNFVNMLAFRLRERGISLLQTSIPPFPDFSYVVAQTEESVVIVLGRSPIRSARYAIFDDLRGQGLGDEGETVAEWYKAHSMAWDDVLAVTFSADILPANLDQRNAEIEAAVARIVPVVEAHVRDPQKPEIPEINDELCFVIMSFSGNPQLKDFYDKAIKPTVRKLGYRCQRVDEQHFNDSVRFHILDNIRRARFIVADMTEARPNCYYELGIAHALEKEVIHLARESKDVHFDVHDFNFIIYERIDELKRRLHDRIVATVGVRVQSAGRPRRKAGAESPDKVQLSHPDMRRLVEDAKAPGQSLATQLRNKVF